MPKPVTYAQIIEQMVQELDGPVPLDDLVARVLEIKPSRARKPAQSVRQELKRYGWESRILILDGKMVIPTGLVMQGVRFALPITDQEAEHGMLIISPAFRVYKPHDLPPEAVQLEDAGGNRLPTEVDTVTTTETTPLGPRQMTHTVFRLPEWFKAHRIAEGDFVLVTIVDWAQGRYRLVHETAESRCEHRDEISRRNQALVAAFLRQLEASYAGWLPAQRTALIATALLPDPQGYPGDPWHIAIEADMRMMSDGFMVHYIDDPDLLASVMREMGYLDTPEPAPRSISMEEAEAVYRFRAALNYRKSRWHEIEMQGAHTLTDFDGMLREAFKHDFFDHLSGFSKRVSRGKGRLPKDVDLATINPFEDEEGADIQIAALDLAPGDGLIYVYDFGDWVEHTIELQAIMPPEPGVEYPRIVRGSKPRTKVCGACKAEGRKVEAVYECMTCAPDGPRVYLCEDHAQKHDSDHVVEELLD